MFDHQDGWTPFNLACKEGQVEVIKLLIAYGRVDVNEADEVYLTSA